MYKRLARSIFPLCSLFFFIPGSAAEKYGLAAENNIQAQVLVREIMAQHPELLSAGMHCTRPGETVQKIIASTLNVIGKPSDPPDVDVGRHGETILSPNLKIPKLGIMLPLRDRHGQEIGALALAFKYDPAAAPAIFLAKATDIRDETAKKIEGLADLFASSGMPPSGR